MAKCCPKLYAYAFPLLFLFIYLLFVCHASYSGPRRVYPFDPIVATLPLTVYELNLISDSGHNCVRVQMFTASISSDGTRGRPTLVYECTTHEAIQLAEPLERVGSHTLIRWRYENLWRECCCFYGYDGVSAWSPLVRVRDALAEGLLFVDDVANNTNDNYMSVCVPVDGTPGRLIRLYYRDNIPGRGHFECCGSRVDVVRLHLVPLYVGPAVGVCKNFESRHTVRDRYLKSIAPEVRERLKTPLCVLQLLSEIFYRMNINRPMWELGRNCVHNIRLIPQVGWGVELNGISSSQVMQWQMYQYAAQMVRELVERSGKWG